MWQTSYPELTQHSTAFTGLFLVKGMVDNTVYTATTMAQSAIQVTLHYLSPHWRLRNKLQGSIQLQQTRERRDVQML